DEIFTGFPNPDLFLHDAPAEKVPIVAVYFYGKNTDSLGYEELIRREDVGVAPVVRRDITSLANLEVNCDIYVLAAKKYEVIGTAAWEAYVEQIMRIVCTHSEIINTQDTIITWELGNFDIPGEVMYAQDRRLSLGIIETLLTGKLVVPPPVAGQITEIVPHLDDFTPVPPP
ncbi:unnamed protein product, partial [marine sediment metagenome]